MIGASLATGTVLEQRAPRTGLCMRHGCRVGTAHVPAARASSVIAFDRLHCAANAKINLRMFSIYSLPVEFML